MPQQITQPTDVSKLSRALIGQTGVQLIFGLEPKLSASNFPADIVAATFAAAFDDAGRSQDDWFSTFMLAVNDPAKFAGLDRSLICADLGYHSLQIDTQLNANAAHQWFGRLIPTTGRRVHGVIVTAAAPFVRFAPPLD